MRAVEVINAVTMMMMKRVMTRVRIKKEKWNCKGVLLL